ncbi:MAG: hypothetical protein IT281_09345 [Ignavibacteria bacterium]|nr:hypothetical protein [Ignavibacteria bacterium]
MTQHQKIIEAKATQVNEKHLQDLKRLLNYKRVLVETINYAKKELVNTDYLIRVLTKLDSEDLTVKPFDQFCRENFGFNVDRFNRLLSNGTVLNKEEIENIVIYLNKNNR